MQAACETVCLVLWVVVVVALLAPVLLVVGV